MIATAYWLIYICMLQVTVHVESKPCTCASSFYIMSATNTSEKFKVHTEPECLDASFTQEKAWIVSDQYCPFTLTALVMFMKETGSMICGKDMGL